MIEKSIASQAGAERLIYKYKKAVSASKLQTPLFLYKNGTIYTGI